VSVTPASPGRRACFHHHGERHGRRLQDFLRNEVLAIARRSRAEDHDQPTQSGRGARNPPRRRAADSWCLHRVRTALRPIGPPGHDPIFEASLDHYLVLTSHFGTFWQKATPLSEGPAPGTGAGSDFGILDQHGIRRQHEYQGLFDKCPVLDAVVIKEGGFWWLPDSWRAPTNYYLSHPGDIKLTGASFNPAEKFLAKLAQRLFREPISASPASRLLPAEAGHFKWLMAMCRGGDWLLYCPRTGRHATLRPPLNWCSSAAISGVRDQEKSSPKNARSWISGFRQRQIHRGPGPVGAALVAALSLPVIAGAQRAPF